MNSYRQNVCAVLPLPSRGKLTKPRAFAISKGSLLRELSSAARLKESGEAIYCLNLLKSQTVSAKSKCPQKPPCGGRWHGVSRDGRSTAKPLQSRLASVYNCFINAGIRQSLTKSRSFSYSTTKSSQSRTPFAERSFQLG